MILIQDFYQKELNKEEIEMVSKTTMEKEEVIKAAREVSIKMEHFDKAFSIVRPSPGDLTVFESITEFKKAVHKHKRKRLSKI